MKLNQKLVSPILMWVIIFAGAALSFLIFPKEKMFSVGSVSYIAFGMALANWIYLLSLAGSVHRKAARSAAAIDKLVTEGIYAYIRHPIYTADIILAWAIFLIAPIVPILASVIWLTVVMLFWANLEERALEEKFMDDYRAYRKQTSMLLPRFKK